MIRRIALASALLALLAASAASAQGFHALFTPDGLDVWAVGDSGAIYRSTNGGADFFRTSCGTAPLRGIAAQGLTALLVSDGGVVWRSTNSGGAWSSQVLSGAPDLKSLAFPSPSVAYVSGALGAIWKSVDGGGSWNAQTTSTTATLWGLEFTDDSNGWAVGDGGTVRRTGDGGKSWVPVAVPTTNRLLAVDQSGSTVWVVGERGTCLRSTDGGDDWLPVNLKLDALADVRAVRVASPENIWIGGGGGFVRRSDDGGGTWTFLQHRMHGALSALVVESGKAFFCSSHNRAVFRSLNGGDTWLMPTGTTMSQTFVQKYSYKNSFVQVRGNGIALNPANGSTIYCAIGDTIYRSGDDGDSWRPAATFPSNITKINAFLISPKDTSMWLAAAGGNAPLADRILRTTNAGATWDSVYSRDFGEYGVPLEMNPDKPDTVFLGSDASVLYRTTDFGLTWAPVMVDSAFRSPCDIVCVPDSSNILYVSDGITGLTNPPGQYYKSVDNGVSFELMASRTGIPGASEIPGLACSRLRNNVVLGTNWSQGGVQRSTDYGTTWPTASNAQQAWGIDIARDDPNFVIFGQYSGNATYMSYDGGATWPLFPITNNFGNNYAVFARDREVVIAMQGYFQEPYGGMWKLQTTYPYAPSATQDLYLSAPRGGQTWNGGSVHTIVWTQFNVPVVRIEYQKTEGDPWQLVAEVPGDHSSYAWTVPMDVTYDARIRLSDAWDDAPADSSDFGFTIAVPAVESSPKSLAFGDEPKGSATTLAVTLNSTGSGTVHVTAVTVAGEGFTIGRSSFQIPAGSSDTVGVTFRPIAGAGYSGSLDIASDAFGTPSISIPLAGTGIVALFAAFPNPLDFGSYNPGATVWDTLHVENNGNGTLTISSVSVDNPDFYAGRKSFSIPGGSSDTLDVYYHPLVAGADTATITIVASDTTEPHTIAVYGNARANVAVEAAAPTAFALVQNKPNPFGRSTEIRYALPRSCDVDLEVFDLEGERVATLVSGFQSPGWYSAPFGPGAAASGGARLGTIASGVYFYRLRAGPFTSTRKMLFVK